MYKEEDGILRYYCPKCDGELFFFAPTGNGFTIIQPSQIAIMENIKPILEQTVSDPQQTYCKDCYENALLSEAEELLQGVDNEEKETA